MSGTMSYKGYAARVDYDDEDAVFIGRIAGIRDGVGFHADTVAGLRAAFEEAVEDYLETCARVGREPQKPCSGTVRLQIDPDLHSRAMLAADLAGKSLDRWAEEILAQVV
ncbi:MAG: type II toxin-antitoxin system HicB family antitoxin [Alphaproteobacteria bacterium]|nr:type II toxin-antitoxin system HicB family antitoxin [Alphaproteobacteria bacterium]